MFIPHKQRDITRYSLLFVFVLLLGCGGPERVPLRGGTEHLLLLHNRVLRYEERYHRELKTFTMRMHYAGGRSVRVYSLQMKGADWGNCSFISSGSQVFFETNKPSTALQDVPEFRQLWINEELSVGDGWEDQDTGTQTVVAPSETITVPAGTFENCYKTVTTGTQELLDSLQSWHEKALLADEDFETQLKRARIPVVRWFASGVGLVKEQIGGPEWVRELSAIEKMGTGRVDIENPEDE